MSWLCDRMSCSLAKREKKEKEGGHVERVISQSQQKKEFREYKCGSSVWPLDPDLREGDILFDGCKYKSLA
ncbi:hypothetical protein FRX31_015062 [Thalictrum thalictroides]|uniref:Uncharacterized protein n=1 Tax=Thalictrum thalictroides TaxID=46969 RepID=A0A7J6WGY6_THATH|nr:hypothetical protein FRX31_015062 [Thalictrum thalictroides]